ncbi:MAG: hypothetical protein P8L18_09310 [Verrucomicrobiota bacterium]|nr:hypothetical protein [Verrucomicrobiota bacterium]
MKTVTMLADSPQDAVRKARQQYGPRAVIQEVRQHAAQGLARIWRKPQLELVIQVPSQDNPPPVDRTPGDHQEETAPPFFKVYQQELQKTVEPEDPPVPAPRTRGQAGGQGQWRVEPILKSMGLSDYWISEMLERLALRFQGGMPDYVRDELAFCRSLVMELLPSPTEDPRTGERPLVFLGPAGCGKTTVLCKWMAHLVFQRNLTPSVWRLDGIQPNTTEMLDVYAEMLQASISRFPEDRQGDLAASPLFIDLPGIATHFPDQCLALETQLESLPACDRYLVLNACYATSNLNEQIRAFERFKLKGIVLTHIDEQPHWGNLMNVLLGTNCPVVLLSGGQKIPGTFELFRSSSVISSVFPSNLDT